MSRDTPDTTPPVDSTSPISISPVSTSRLAAMAGIEPVVLGSLCTGYGGLDLGVAAAFGGARLAWCADPDPHVSTILAARFSEVVNLGDIRTIDWHAVAPVDVVTAGFPCQDISSAGKRAGIEKGERSGVWKHIALAIRILRPKYAVVENVAALRWRNGGLHRVLGDLAEAGYDAVWRSVRASDVGAPHRRERVLLLAVPTAQTTDAAHATSTRRRQPRSDDAGTTPRGRTSGQPQRRCAWARTAVADADSGRLSVGRDPDRDPSGSADAERVRHVDRLRMSPAHPDGLGCQELHASNAAGRAVAARPSPACQDETAPDTTGNRWHEGRAEPARIQGRPHAALDRPWPVDTARTATGVASELPIDWGIYAPAIEHWQHILGRPAPYPTQPGRHGRPVLSPAFSEFMMGLEPGWLTDLPIPRTAQLRALGNGVVPQQAAHAVRLLLADLAELHTVPPGTQGGTCDCEQHVNGQRGKAA